MTHRDDFTHREGDIDREGASPPTPTGRVAALVLAAGASQRLGTPKQLLAGADGQPLVSRVVRDARDAGFDPIVVVIGAHAEEVTHALIRDAGGVFLVPHRHWAEGMGSSIRAGIAAMSVHGMMQDVEGVLIAACDMPSADAAHFARLRQAATREGMHEAMDEAQPGDGGPAGSVRRAASVYVSRNDTGAETAAAHGIPAIFPRADWPALLALEGDRGAKALLDAAHAVGVELIGGNFDLDTAADVAAWRSAEPGGSESPP